MNTDSRILAPDELDHPTRATWDKLLAASPVPSAFLSATYARAAHAAFGNSRVCVIRRDNEDVAFFPFCLPGARARLLRAGAAIGEHFSDYVGLVAQVDFHTSPKELLHACHLNSLLFTHLDETQASHGLTGVKPAKGLRIRRARDEDFLLGLAQRDKKFFQDTERRFKKLERDRGPLRFAIEEPGSNVLTWLIDTKVAQYQRTGRKKHPFSSQSDRELLHALAAQDDPLCKPRLTALYCNDKVIAAHFGLQCGDTLAYWFPVYDTEYHSYSPGRLLMWETLKRAPEMGIHCVDRGEGESQAKRDFANEEHTYFRGYYARKNIPAFIDKSLNSLRWRLESRSAKQAVNKAQHTAQSIGTDASTPQK